MQSSDPVADTVSLENAGRLTRAHIQNIVDGHVSGIRLYHATGLCGV